MLSIKEIIVVEGKYDKIRVGQAVNAVIITTDGFRLYKNKEKLDLLRRLSAERGIIVLTDSDSAGFQIRNYLRNCLGDVNIKHAYIPETEGTEKRKAKPGKEGLLGVEGMCGEIIVNALKKANATPASAPGEGIKKADFYEHGLAGTADSAGKRKILAKKMGLPSKISANALLEVMNLLYTKDECLRLMDGD